MMFVKTMRMGSLIVALCLITGIVTISNAIPSYAAPSPETIEQPQDNLLKIGDKINVLVEGEKDLSASYTINKAGEINMPLIGKIFVAGKTPHEAKFLIVQKLQDGYLHHPDVAIKEGQHKKHSKSEPAHEKEAGPAKDIKQHKHRQATKHMHPKQQTRHKMKHVYVVGAINNPGYYKLPSHAGHILNVVALAGGYTNKANKKEFELVRDIDGVYYRQQAQTGALKYHNGDILIIE